MSECKEAFNELCKKNGFWYKIRFIKHTKNFEDLVDGSNKTKTFLMHMLGDVDNLGKTFMKIETLDGYIQLSNEIERIICCGIYKGIEEGSNIYIGYVGGDDVYIIAEWDKCLKIYISLVEELKPVTFSSGAVLVKVKEPAYLAKKFAQENEVISKTNKNLPNSEGKDCITFIGASVKNQDIKDVVMYMEKDKEKDVSSFLYKILNIANKEIEKVENGEEWCKSKTKLCIYLNYHYGRLKQRKEDLVLEGLEKYMKDIGSSTKMNDYLYNLKKLKTYISLISLSKRKEVV
jgi:CRISPR/Cas system-associated protein Cas10 (large subunit of type III CRISPR-Cas system)